VRALFVAAVALALTCAGPGQGKADVARDDLRFRLDAQATYTAGGPVPIGFTLENLSDRPLRVLTWYTPLEGLNGKIFRVARDGRQVEYRGRMVKRGNPTAADYVRVPPRSSVSASVDLATAYDLSTPGAYRVEFVGRIHDVTPKEGAVPRAADDQRGLDITGNAVDLRIVAK
jgi:peptidyl-Lys metalloendopeptidase